jgi:hypothetical protein
MVPDEGGSMPYIGTISVLTFNLINSLAESVNRSNALFWLTVWLTAKGHGPWTTDWGYWSRLSLSFGYRLGGGPQSAGGGSWITDLG